MTSFFSPTLYYPISLLPILSKTPDHAVHKQIAYHLTENHLLYPMQSGLRSGHSTATALLLCTNDCYTALDMVSWLVSFSLMYLTVDHSLLARKLRALECCTLKPQMDGVLPRSPYTAQYRIPLLFLWRVSGICLESHPFILWSWINDLLQAITGATTLLFADDTSIYMLLEGYGLTYKWLYDNHLSLNVHKIKTMLVH